MKAHEKIARERAAAEIDEAIGKLTKARSHILNTESTYFVQDSMTEVGKAVSILSSQANDSLLRVFAFAMNRQIIATNKRIAEGV